MGYFISKKLGSRFMFALRHPSVILNGFFSYERFDRQRIQYAKDNPWVMNYDFGHKELIEKANRDGMVI